eukprot:199825-Chlamydomonas_euryale.AAC.1
MQCRGGGRESYVARIVRGAGARLAGTEAASEAGTGSGMGGALITRHCKIVSGNGERRVKDSLKLGWYIGEGGAKQGKGRDVGARCNWQKAEMG